MTNFNIKVVSDVICPWCYIGKKRLERAIDLYKRTIPNGASDTFTVTWHPFYLDPSLPKVGVERAVHLSRKFGADAVPRMQARLRQVGEAEGIHFSPDGKIGNTRDGHRLVQLAKTKGPDAENRVISELFRAHFEDGGDVTDTDMLLDAVEKAGLDRAEAKEWLDQGKGGEEVDKEVEVAYGDGIHGVPNYLINDKYQIEGAEDPQTFIAGFLRAKQAVPDAAGAPTAGISC